MVEDELNSKGVVGVDQKRQPLIFRPTIKRLPGHGRERVEITVERLLVFGEALVIDG